MRSDGLSRLVLEPFRAVTLISVRERDVASERENFDGAQSDVHLIMQSTLAERARERQRDRARARERESLKYALFSPRLESNKEEEKERGGTRRRVACSLRLMSSSRSIIST